MTRDSTCQHCSTLRHNCFGLAGKVCSWCQQDKKVCQEVVVFKNGFSDPTKFKIGRDWPRQDVGCECQGKALKEGCREREAARKSVSSTEKINTKENLARVTAKS